MRASASSSAGPKPTERRAARRLGWNDLDVGRIDAKSSSVGGYATLVGAAGWYVDAVLMRSWFKGDASASSDLAIDIDGTGWAASLEAGYPIALSTRWTLEPQAQIVWQDISLDDRADMFSAIDFAGGDSFTGRLGLRLQGEYGSGAARFQPYLHASLWHGLSGHSTTRFGTDPIRTDLRPDRGRGRRRAGRTVQRACRRAPQGRLRLRRRRPAQPALRRHRRADDQLVGVRRGAMP